MGRRDFSIGLYSIDNYRRMEGSEGEGFSADLWRISTKIAHIEDYGDGGEPHVNFYPESRDYADTVLKEMKLLLQTLKPILQEDALWETFISTPYSAVLGFVELLLELKEFVKVANKNMGTTPEGCYSIVGRMGNSWFTNEDMDKSVTIVNLPTVTSNYDEAYSVMRNFERTHKSRSGTFKQVAILNAEIDWNLNFRDYFELCNVKG